MMLFHKKDDKPTIDEAKINLMETVRKAVKKAKRKKRVEEISRESYSRRRRNRKLTVSFITPSEKFILNGFYDGKGKRNIKGKHIVNYFVMKNRNELLYCFSCGELVVCKDTPHGAYTSFKYRLANKLEGKNESK